MEIDNGKNRLLFSQRYTITSEAEDWCKKNHVHPNTFNMVTALSILGYLDVEKIREYCHKLSSEKFGGCVLSIEENIEDKLDKEVGEEKDTKYDELLEDYGELIKNHEEIIRDWSENYKDLDAKLEEVQDALLLVIERMNSDVIFWGDFFNAKEYEKIQSCLKERYE